ncbi:threonylcarbamoyladenosine tRNA methylthiotransferase MtaB [Treponema bryantii]|uniref:Threonylcarbamoyladenosine tRNA methylthiotransferase MtaB n=1 Tax=Treponema bryantii TaxID=163 RepID=A0A1H9AE40_9SPIR|nr:tRNA (N(6)-L-threonylcarbamoyladenosine(37)-C(2))-methylthiotransferase MtaB [Treponema bryantii]SEP74984.1 threonylcarbamoyladenosine tRNA methylthiotransferase MtaB [Treponema bryantii]
MSEIRIETLGCRLNQIESEATAQFFTDAGFSVSMEGLTSSSDTDETTLLSIINTCTVTQKAEQKARRLIRLMLKKFPSAVIIVTGCYAQLSEKQISEIDPRICVIGGQMKSRLSTVPALLKETKETVDWNPLSFAKSIKKNITSAPQLKPGFPEDSFKLSATSFLSHSRASLKIQDGCNNNCAFCAIHIARGHSVSIDVQTAIDRVQELEAKGQEEVVLTSVNIGQYRGEYNGEYYNFTELLALLLAKTNKIHFRISSLYPDVVDEKFCRVISDDRVQPHFHISVQSGSSKILAAMNRPYSVQSVIDACKRLNMAKNKPFLACDIITGFPGETDEDFEQTMHLCKECDFAWVHAFPYSERPGTVAVTMKNKVPQSVSGERAKTLTDWAVAQKIKYVEQFIDTEHKAVLETVKRPMALAAGGKQSRFIYHAVTDNFIHCEIISDKQIAANQMLKIRLTKVLSERIKKGGDIESSAEFL